MLREHRHGEVVGGRDHEDGGDDDLETKSKFDLVLCLDRVDVSGDERGHETDEHTNG
jgi:hypothetical protein